MIPGMNARQMQQMMKQMGIQQVEVPATQVIIITPDKRIIIDRPQVSKVNMMGQQTWQVVGAAHEERNNILPDISDDDIQTVVDQTGVSREKALQTIKESKGDLAEAIMSLKSD
ncbi:TPA: nascent polypeptide-associated complex protein [Candidatus Woesearchaeota archaeon]|nr:nascent polypeptide-associated complex protein [Candidatus Woesearchaeota archaeon]